MAVCAVTSWSEGGTLCPWGGMKGKEAVAEMSVDGAVTKEPLVSHHHLQAQRKEVRGLVAPGGSTPESPLYSRSQSPDRKRTP